MSVSTVILLILFCTGASFVQRVSGFGFGIFIMTILPHFMPYSEATTLSGILSATQSLYVLFAVYKYINWKHLLPILTAFIVTSYFAVQYVAIVSDTHLKHLLGIVLILLSIYFLTISERVHLKPTLAMQFSMGSVSGIMGGLFAMQGPPAVLYFVASETDKTQYLAITQAYFFIGNSMMTIFRASEGFFTINVGKCWLIALIGVVIGTQIGKYVFDKISSSILRKAVYVYMIIAGILAIAF